MPTKNMRLLMLNGLVGDDMVGIPIRLEVNTPIFKIAFADSSSSAKSNPLTKFTFATLLLKKWSFSFCLTEDDFITKGKKDVVVFLINGNILVRKETPITAIANMSMIKVIIETIS
jgi:hypothetical protein